VLETIAKSVGKEGYSRLEIDSQYMKCTHNFESSSFIY